MPTAATATGGKPKGKKKPAMKPAKKSKKSTKGKAAPKKGANRTMESYKKEAKRMGIPLSKDGKAKTKPQLAAAISYRKK